MNTPETQGAARLTFEDGHTQSWRAAPGLNISGAAIAEFMRIVTKPTPILVEVVEIPKD